MGAWGMSNITEWRKVALIIVPSQEVGDNLYLALRAFQHDPTPDQSKFNIQLNGGAYAAELLAKQSLADIVDDFNSGGYPAELQASMTNDEIDALRTVVFADHYDLYPDNQTRTIQPNALDDFIIAKGFERA